MTEATIRLEIWVGTDEAADGHEQELTIEQVKLLGPIIGADAVGSLLKFACNYSIDT